MKVLFGFLVFGTLLFGLSPEFVEYQEDDLNLSTGINNLADYKRTETELLKLISIEEYDATYFLGRLYMRDHNLSDINIKRDSKKAKKAFDLGVRHGIVNSAIYLGMLELNEKNHANALATFEKIVKFEDTKAKKIPPKQRLIMAMMFSSVVLQHFIKEDIAVNNAIRYVEPLAVNQKSLRGAFYLAHLYKARGNIRKANMYLNIACLNSQTPPEIKKECFNSDYVEVVPNSENNDTNTTK
ncbi:MAG: Unknown protein [uncultured Campylobacterales bacterium]|uniref:Uncharacterized protein n=1 Tax=uncultured Campylobacterales bacterium TaxID=352960 RepID=A0A6S6SE07_9BACT|nr:MAG: Unknown protein [uncultured Campylobacterales bacterium]